MTDLTILDAIALRLEAVTPPTGYTLRKVYATPPEGLPVTPAIVLFPGDDSVAIGNGNRILHCEGHRIERHHGADRSHPPLSAPNPTDG